MSKLLIVKWTYLEATHGRFPEFWLGQGKGVGGARTWTLLITSATEGQRGWGGVGWEGGGERAAFGD